MPSCSTGDKKTTNSPMELVLIGLLRCYGLDARRILRKKREPFTSLEVRASAERSPEPPTVYTSIVTYVVGGKVSRKAVEDAGAALEKEDPVQVSGHARQKRRRTPLSEVEIRKSSNRCRQRAI